MNITVLGFGNFGGTPRKKWAAVGHEVRFGVRDMGAPKHRLWLEACGQNAAVVTVGEAITFCYVVLLAVPSAAVDGVQAEHGRRLAFKILRTSSESPQ